MNNAPNISTHIPLKVEIPKEHADQDEHRRADIPPPNIWQRAVGVVHKATGMRAAVHALDLMTRQFRAYYPDQIDPETGNVGRFGNRTEWHAFDDWNVDVTFSPAELERQAAAASLTAELDSLNEKELRFFAAFCQDEDPRKALGKLEAMRGTDVGFIRPKADPPVVTAINDPKKDAKK